MSRVEIAVRAGPDGGAPVVQHLAGGTAKAQNLLRPAEPVRGHGWSEPLNALGEIHRLKEPQQHAIGEHLARALDLPPLVEGDVLSLHVGPLWLRALPWHLLRSGVSSLVHLGVEVQVLPDQGPGQAPLGLHLRVLAVDLRPVAAEVGLAELWSDALHISEGERHAVSVQTTPPPSLPPLDVLHLLVEPDAPDGVLRLLPGYAWTALPERLRTQHPRLLILESEAPPTRGLVELAARLSELVPCVVLACAPAPDDTLDDAFRTGPRLVSTMLTGPMSAAMAARRLSEQTPRPPGRQLWVWGGAIPARPPRVEELGRWYFDPGWRLTLDRKTQTRIAIGAIKDGRDARESGLQLRDLDRQSQPDRPSADDHLGHAAVVLLWHGEEHSGLERFRARLELEVQRERLGCVPLGLLWPEVPGEADWSAELARALGCSLPRSREAQAEALRGALRHHISRELNLRDEALRGAAVLMLYQEPLHEGMANKDVSGELLERYIGWFRDTVAPLSPRHAVPVLALAVRGGPQDPLIVGLRSRLGQAVDALRPVELVDLPVLPDILPTDVVDHIIKYKLMRECAPPEIREVADYIVDRTGGHYEPTLWWVEQIPWVWRTFLRDARQRKRTRR